MSETPSVTPRLRWSQYRKHLQITGVTLVVAGGLAVAFPLVSSVVTKMLIGWVFLMVGGIILHHAMWSRTASQGLIIGLLAVFYLALGVYLAFVPLGGIVGLTVTTAVLFLIEGVMSLFLAQVRRPKFGWRWMMMSGGGAIVAGATLLVTLPHLAYGTLGFLTGLNVLTTGIAFCAISRSMRKHAV